jgi:hypothetical protein
LLRALITILIVVGLLALGMWLVTRSVIARSSGLSKAFNRAFDDAR